MYQTLFSCPHAKEKSSLVTRDYECHWSTSHVHAVMIEMSNCGFIAMIFVKYNKIWELRFLNLPKFYHLQYSKLVYSPMFSSSKSRIYRFAKVLPCQSFALYGIMLNTILEFQCFVKHSAIWLATYLTMTSYSYI